MLGSVSPRRLDLLRQIGFVPDAIVGAELDESSQSKESPRQLALRLARLIDPTTLGEVNA